jgi:hypothetical protein
LLCKRNCHEFPKKRKPDAIWQNLLRKAMAQKGLFCHHEVINNMMNGKSPGPVNINLELIKCGGRKLLALVTKLLNKILHGDNIPQLMTIGYLIQIYKEINRNVRITEALVSQIHL